MRKYEVIISEIGTERPHCHMIINSDSMERIKRMLINLSRVYERAETERDRINLELEKAERQIDVDIKDIGLTARIYNILRRNGIATIGDLLERDKKSLMKIRGLGSGALDIIIDAVRVYDPGWLMEGQELRPSTLEESDCFRED